MNTNAYKLTFLPLFKEDLLETVDYISNTLQNPTAAHRLVDDIELAIDKRLESPLLFAPYQSSTTREHPYTGLTYATFLFFTLSRATLWKCAGFYIQNEILTPYWNNYS